MKNIDSEAAAVQRLFDISKRYHLCTSDDFKALIERFPNAVRVKDAYGSLPLHYACRNGFYDYILILIQSWPQSVQIVTANGSLPLHYACAGRLPLSIIRLLVQAWPDAVHLQENSGHLPLHCAICYKCTDEVIQFLFHCWPQAVRCKTDHGYHPLRYACNQGGSLPVIHLLMKAWPDAVRLQDDYGRLPLHFALKYGCNADVIQFLVHSYPESCRLPTNQGELPLHYACHNQSLAVILFLLDCYPQAVRHKDNNLRLPLHTACLQLHSHSTTCLTVPALTLEVIEHLVRAWPDSIQVPCLYICKNKTSENDENYGEDQDSDMDYDLIGDEVDDSNDGGGSENDEHTINPDKVMLCNTLALDLACAWERKPSPEFICLLTNQMPPLHFVCTYATKYWGPQTIVTMDYLLSVFPQDAMLFYHGMLPIHCMCCAGGTRSLLKWWWKKCPEVIKLITMDTGDTLLHCYLSSAALSALTSHRKKQCFSTVQFLLEKHPDALRATNRMGWLPFHMAAVHQAPLEVLFYLVCQNPEALLCCSF